MIITNTSKLKTSKPETNTSPQLKITNQKALSFQNQSQSDDDNGNALKVRFKIKREKGKFNNRKIRTQGERECQGFYQGGQRAGRSSSDVGFQVKRGSQQALKKIEGRLTKSEYFCLKEDKNFVPIDPNRVSRYRQSTGQCEKQHQKWDKSLQRYMQARTKMSSFFNTTRKSTEFDQIELDRNHLILRNRKLLQLKTFSPTIQSPSPTSSQFVSHLIPKDKQKYKIMKNKMIESVSTDGEVKRCDALLVNFVSTYFRRKFYKKNRKVYAMNRTKTDDPQLMQMVDLQGKAINDEIINSFFDSVEIKSEQKYRTNVES